MWIFTETGFVSAVTDRNDSKRMVVRARDKKSIQPLAELAGVKISQITGDYPYRVFVSKKDVKKWMNSAIDAAQYDNFKSRVRKTRGDDFVNALHKVWSTMMSVTDTKKAKGRSTYFYDDADYISSSRQTTLWWEDVESDGSEYLHPESRRLWELEGKYAEEK